MGRELNMIKLAARARGIVFVEVTNKTVKKITGKSVQALRNSRNGAPAKDRPFWDAAIEIRKILDRINTSDEWCKPTLSDEFKERALLKKEESWRTDTLMTLAFQTVEDSIQCVSVCSYGEADKSDRTFEDAVLEDHVGKGRVLEIDLLCSRGGSRGTGSLLLTYCIAKQLARRAKNSFKYLDVVIPLAGHGNPLVRPLQNAATRLGFQEEPSGEGEYGQEFIVSIGRDDLVLPDLDALEKLCALQPRSGLQYCQ
jgi:hypothetical protein